MHDLKGRDSAATRARIEREALRLFAEKGFDGTSVRDIALSVGVADAALYRHFKSKEAIGRELFLLHYRALAEDITAIGRRPDPFERKVRALIDLLCAMFDETPDVFAFILLNQHAHLRFVSAEGGGNAVEALRTLIASARQTGTGPDRDADLATAKALGVVLQPAMFVLYGRLPGPMAAYAENLTEAALQVIGVP